MKNKTTLKITYAAICLALCLALPFLTGQIPQIGKMLSPMHIGVFLCGFLCGWPYGLFVGGVAPLLRSVLFGQPMMFPDAFAMAFELATYGFLAGLLYEKLPKKIVNIYISLLVSMIGGRLIWGAARFTLLGLSETKFPFSAFWAGAVTNAVPGIILHIILVPVIVIAVQKAGLLPQNKE
ncbi:MAG: ECF transporter S component [Clostridia bacterium]|nr:ECF transporter S component [Clostridia bacterium]